MTTHDRELTKAISITLRTGIVLAVSCGLLGCILYLPTSGHDLASFRQFKGSHVPFSSLHAIRTMLAQPQGITERGYGIAEVGVLLLMATPIVRVILSLASFLRDKDIFFASITLVVLAALACSLLAH